jgi:hypothetical protein
MKDHAIIRGGRGEAEVWLVRFLTSALDGRERSVSTPDKFTLDKYSPGTQRMGGSVEHRACLDAVGKRKICSLTESRAQIIQTVA